jgi:hypothetical protein
MTRRLLPCLGALLLCLCLGPAPVRAGEEPTPEERARLDHDAMRATRHLDLYGRYLERTRELNRAAGTLRGTTGPTPEAERERQVRLRDLEERLIPQSRERTRELGSLWDERWGVRLGPISRYGTTTPQPYLDNSGGQGPGVVRTRDVDYLPYRIRAHFRLDEPLKPSAEPAARLKGMELPPIPKDVAEAPAVATEPVRIPGADATWDEMTPEKRHESLLDCVAEAWNALALWLASGDAGKKQAADEALGELPAPPEATGEPRVTGEAQAAAQSEVQSFEAARAEEVRRERAAEDPVARWKSMGVEARHRALLDNDPVAWDAVKALLTSGNEADVDEVLRALERIPKKSSADVPPPPEALLPTEGTIQVSVSKPTGEGGSPFGEESLTEPVAGAEIRYTYLSAEGPYENSTTTGEDGRAEITVPLEVEVELTWVQGREIRHARCERDRALVSVPFGGPEIKAASTSDPMVPREPPPPIPDR